MDLAEFEFIGVHFHIQIKTTRLSLQFVFVSL